MKQRNIKICIASYAGKTYSESFVCLTSYFYCMSNLFWSAAQDWKHSWWGMSLQLLVKSLQASREHCKRKGYRVKYEMTTLCGN